MDSARACRGRIVPPHQKFFLEYQKRCYICTTDADVLKLYPAFPGNFAIKVQIMDVSELTIRLRKLGMTKVDLASYLGVARGTVYHWEDTPKYVVRVVELLEYIDSSGGKLAPILRMC